MLSNQSTAWNWVSTMRVEVTGLWIPLCMVDHPQRFLSREFLKMFSCGICLHHFEPSGSSKWEKNTWFIICMVNAEQTRSGNQQKNHTFEMSASFHGPLSERIQPPLSAQVQVPPKISGNSLVTVERKRRRKEGFLSFISGVKEELGKWSFMSSTMKLPGINCFKQLALVFVTQKLIKNSCSRLVTLQRWINLEIYRALFLFLF